MAHVLASTLARTTAAVTVNSRRYMGRSDLESSIAPWEKGLTCLPPLSLAQLRPTLWSTTVGTCRRDFL